jgi:hypothetical protein
MNEVDDDCYAHLPSGGFGVDPLETKLCRSSRGVQSAGLSPAVFTTRRNARRTLAASSLVPTCEANTRPVLCQASPAWSRASSCSLRWLRSAVAPRTGRARVRRDFLVLVSPPSRTERHTWIEGGIGGLALGCFRGCYLGGEPTPSDESSVVRWVPRDELDSLNIHPSMRLRIQHGYEHRAEPYIG